jgi:hypothetical protein
LARIHGKSGIVYVGVASGAAASPIAFLNDWTMNFTLDKVEVTAFQDLNKVYVAGLPDASGDFSGWYDDASSQTYIAARDGIARNFYLYPNTALDPNQYFFGSVFPDFQTSGGVGKAVTIKASWVAAGPIQRYGSGGLNT